MAALWGLAALWITINPLTGDHTNATSRCLQSITLLLVTAAGATLVVWLIQYLLIVPQNKAAIDDRKFELGYYAGRADVLNEIRAMDDLRPSLGLVATINGSTGHTGT